MANFDIRKALDKRLGVENHSGSERLYIKALSKCEIPINKWMIHIQKAINSRNAKEFFTYVTMLQIDC